MCEGVQTHLGATDAPSRRLGMKVAEHVPRIIDPEHPLDFDAGEAGSDEEAAGAASTLVGKWACWLSCALHRANAARLRSALGDRGAELGRDLAADLAA